jgi:hypothetical protein
MKKTLALLLVVLLFVAAWSTIDGSDTVVNIGDESIDGAFGAVLGVVFGAVGLLIAGIAMLVAAVVTGVALAGAGVVVVAAMLLVALILAGVAVPFLLPVLIPLAILWWVARRDKQQRTRLLQQAV